METETRGTPVGFFAAGRSPTCLLVHGFTASAEEMRFLGERLAQSGRQVVGVQLAGHGTRVEHLARTSWQDWYHSVRGPLFALASPQEPAVLIGQSLGGLLALWAAARHPERVGALVLLAPAIQLRARWLSLVRPILPALARWRTSWPKGESDIADPEARRQRVGYTEIPLAALAQLLELQRHVRRVLRDVRQPVLLFQSVQDHTCSWRGVERLEASLSGPLEIERLQQSFHVLSVDVEREAIAERIARFLAQFAPPLGRDR